MKVLVLSHLYPNSYAPAGGTFVHNQLRFLKEHCSIEVAAPVPWFPIPGFGRWSAYRRVPRVEVVDGLRICHPRRLALPRRILFTRQWRFHYAALERCGLAAPDLVHAHCAYPDGRAAVEYGARHGKPVVVTVHGFDIKGLPSLDPGFRQLTVEALERADAVVAVSRDLRKDVLELGVSAEKVRWIPNGVDCRLFTGAISRQPGEGGWRLLYVGRFVEEKGLRILLEALGLIRRRRSDISLTLIGGHPATGTSGPFLPQVAALGLSDCVEFRDAVAPEEMPHHMSRHDLVVLPSFYDSFGIVLIEAMACGLPVVATRCGGPEEVVDDRAGRLVEIGNAEDLAAGILAVIDGYSGYDRQAIRRVARERYDYREVVGQIYELYEEVLGAGNGK